MIEEHTDRLLNELSAIKTHRLKEMEIEMEEFDRSRAILNSFEDYWTELKSKGSPRDICISVDELVGKADNLETDHETSIGRPLKSVDVSFKRTDLTEFLQVANGNAVGEIKGTQLTTTFMLSSLYK